jgi:hypothetical protein
MHKMFSENSNVSLKLQAYMERGVCAHYFNPLTLVITGITTGIFIKIIAVI